LPKDSVPKGKLVETGSLRVDRTRALKKLQKYQLPPSVSRLGLWLKVAASSGASSLRLGGGYRGNVYRFDGDPFSERDLKRPYEVLFEKETPGSKRRRHFALALMNSYHRNVSSIEVVSGFGGRRRLRSSKFGEETVEPCDDGKMETIVKIGWPLFVVAYGKAHPAVERQQREGYGRNPLEMTPIRIRTTGAFREFKNIVPAEARRPEGKNFILVDGARIYLKKTWDIDIFGPRFYIGTDGIEVERLTGIKASRKITGWVDDPQLSLNASMTKIVRNKRFERVKKIFQAEVDHFSGLGSQSTGELSR